MIARQAALRAQTLVATEAALRAQAMALGLDVPHFAEEDAPQLFRRWADQVETVGMLEERQIFLCSERLVANRLAHSTFEDCESCR